MKSFSVSEIQYLNRDYCQLFSKPLVYLHYMDHAAKYPNAAYQYVLKKEPFSDETTNESIIDEFCAYEQQTINVSSKCRLMTFIKSFQIEYPGILDGIDGYPDYSLEIVDLSNGKDALPDVTFVWELNRIAPTFCGMVFENIISQCLGVEDRPWDLSNCIYDAGSNVSSDMICGLIERNFISKKFIHRDQHITMNRRNSVLMLGNNERLSAEHFISNIHYLVFLSLLHFMKRDLKGKDVEDALNVLDYLKSNAELLDQYICDMEGSTIVKTISKQTNIEHGSTKRTKELSGEVDFITDQSIIDIKCYKEEEPDNWFGQLWLYEKLFGKHNNLWIINVYNNKVYKFTPKQK